MKRGVPILALAVLLGTAPAGAHHGTSESTCSDSMTTVWAERQSRYYGDVMMPVACTMPLEGNSHSIRMHWYADSRGSMELAFDDETGRRVAAVYCIVVSTLPWHCDVDGPIANFWFYAEDREVTFTLRSDQPLTASFRVGANGTMACWAWEQCMTVYQGLGSFGTRILSWHTPT